MAPPRIRKVFSGFASRSTNKLKRDRAKIIVTKTTPKIIPLPFLDDETPAAGKRGASKKKKEGDE